MPEKHVPRHRAPKKRDLLSRLTARSDAREPEPDRIFGEDPVFMEPSSNGRAAPAPAGEPLASSESGLAPRGARLAGGIEPEPTRSPGNAVRRPVREEPAPREHSVKSAVIPGARVPAAAPVMPEANPDREDFEAGGNTDTAVMPVAKPVDPSREAAWDPFLRDPEPLPSGRFSRQKRDPDLSELGPRKPKRPKKAKQEANKAATTRERQAHQSLGQWFREILLLGLIAVLTAVLLTNYVVQAFFIPSVSMENTLLEDDRVLVNKLTYRFRDPQPGDLVVFSHPDRQGVDYVDNGPVSRMLNEVALGLGLRSSVQDLIKRVVAVGGQTVEVRVGLLFVDGEAVSEPFRKTVTPMDPFGPVTVPEGHVFLLGDNRHNSTDSRNFGAVPESTIVGRAFALIWPVERITRFS